MSSESASGSAPLTNAIGLHARPSVKLTKTAKGFTSKVEIASDPAGPWIDAKSIVRVMAMKAPRDTTLHFRASGPDADVALQALVALVDRDFDEAG